MRYSLLLATVLALQSLLVPAMATEEVNDEGTVVTRQVEGEFVSVIGSVKFAIQNQGLVLSGTSHLQEMLHRTAADLGYRHELYSRAISYEFCSADLAHKMFQADRRNVATCPLTIAVYVLPDNPGVVNIAYRKPLLATPAPEVEAELSKLFESIIEEATAW